MSEWREHAKGREACSRLSKSSSARKRNCTGKYVVYQEGTGSKGGMGNQKVFFGIYAVLSRILERELIVPPFCTHWVEACITADHVWDFAYFNSFEDSHAIPIREFVVYWSSDTFEFYDHVKAATPADDALVFSTLHDPAMENKRREILAPDVKSSREGPMKPFVFYSFAPMSWYQPFTSRVRMAPVLRETAMSALRRSFSDSTRHDKLTCMHVRWGDRMDYFWKGDKKKSLSFYMDLAAQLGIGKRDEVYVATEGLTSDLVSHLESNFARVHHSGTVFPAKNNETLITNFVSHPKRAQLLNDVVGALEVLLCTCSDRFIGTPDSTFTNMILDFRSNLREMFPECYEWQKNVRGLGPFPEKLMPSWVLNWTANHDFPPPPPPH